MERFEHNCESRRQEIDQMFDYLVDNLGSPDVKALLLLLCDLRAHFDDMRQIQPFHSIDESDAQVAQFYDFISGGEDLWMDPFVCFLIHQEHLDLAITRDQLECCFANSPSHPDL